MLKIEGKRIFLTRGDECTITFKLKPKTQNDEYALKTGDIVAFSIYNKKGFDKKPLLLKEVLIAEPTNTVDICLVSEDTKIGNIENKSVDYWYEVQINYNRTILGYDSDGPKIFTLYPEGVDSDE